MCNNNVLSRNFGGEDILLAHGAKRTCCCPIEAAATTHCALQALLRALLGGLLVGFWRWLGCCFEVYR